MEVQSQIKRRLSTPDSIAGICAALSCGSISDRTGLARQVCQQHGFCDARGRLQMAGCLKALGELSRAGHFVLPAARSQPRRGQPRHLDQPLAMPVGMPDDVGAVQGLQLVRVDDESHLRIWNELMMREHPRGAGPLVGAQLRYLIHSSHGWLGAFGFSAAARRLRDREAWIGWDEPTRAAQLHRVVSMSRFLLRPRGCRNLASHLLGAVMRRLADDFDQRFGYRPWLVESFVDTAEFDGGCYRAANWERIGTTQGRGRGDHAHQQAVGAKAIYVYPLARDFRERLGITAPAVAAPLAVGEGLDGSNFAAQEFGGAPLGDARLSARLVASAARLAEQPGRTFSGVAQGDLAAIKGYYRLIDRPDLSEVTMANILAPHMQQTRRRIANESRVLCVADGTTLDYTGLGECEGLGVTGKNQTGASSRGIQMHTTLALNPDGIPLGIVDVRTRLPSVDAPATTPSTPIEQKKTYDWVQGLDSCMALAEQVPETRITCVMDREADFFELFDHHRANPCVDLLIRAAHNRATHDGQTLFDRLRASAPQSQIELTVKRQSARPKRSKQQARRARPLRQAKLELRYQPIKFDPPSNHKNRPILTLWAVHVLERHAPEDASPLEWCLLSSREVASEADAQQCLRDYALRWRIEDWHRVLKTGCQVEELAHQQVDRLERSIAINLVIAWRIMVMTLLGREVPKLPAQIMFTDIEIEVLAAWAGRQRRKLKPPELLGDAIVLVAMIGGYTHRNNGPPPGHELMWFGYQNLMMMSMGYELRE